MRSLKKSLIDYIRICFAFVRRDILVFTSYRFVLITSILFNIGILIAALTLINRLGFQSEVILREYGMTPTLYVFMGLIMWNLLTPISSSISDSVTEELTIGTFESLLITSIPISIILTSFIIKGMAVGILISIICGMIGVLLFNIHTSLNLFILFWVFFWTVFIMIGLSLFFGGLTILYKKLGMVLHLIEFGSMFLVGVFFPIHVLPKPLMNIAKWIPFYYPVEAIRYSVTDRSLPEDLFWILPELSLVWLGLGIISFYLCYNHARRIGNLTYY